jgi:hypothetical protein
MLHVSFIAVVFVQALIAPMSLSFALHLHPQLHLLLRYDPYQNEILESI